TAVEIAGGVTSVVGLAGLFSNPIGVAMTLGGFGTFVAGHLVSSMGRTQLRDVNDALILIRDRRTHLLTELKRRN
ncbi:MAG: hypothetical protein AB3N11_17955, partial [Arenibacterium sp.]